MPRAEQKMPETTVGFTSGAMIDIMKIDPNLIFVQDIQKTQIRMPRFAGHTLGHETWALINHLDICRRIAAARQHKIQRRLSDMGLPTDFGYFQRALFLHDAPEYITSDIPSPVKSALKLLGGYAAIQAIDKAIEIAILLRFDIDYKYYIKIKDLIKEIDRDAYFAEAVAVRPSFAHVYPGDTEAEIANGKRVMREISTEYNQCNFLSGMTEYDRTRLAENLWAEIFPIHLMNDPPQRLPNVLLSPTMDDDHPDDWVVSVIDQNVAVITPNYVRDRPPLRAGDDVLAPMVQG
jgi:5'-deoxynucleotidase YfbR-like HD superfamily hydrolase